MINYQKFYRLLDRMTVRIPEPDAANPAQLHEIGKLLIRTNNHRAALDRTLTKLDRLIGSTKNDIEIVKEQLRIDRAEARHDPNAIAGCNNKEEREAMVDLLTRRRSAQLAQLQAKRSQLEHAKQAVESKMNTLKACKETLNSLKTIILSDMENSE